MGFPVNAVTARGQMRRTGIVLSIAPSSDLTVDTEVVRRSSSQSTGVTWRRLSGLSVGGRTQTLTDMLPEDGRTWYYKMRHVADGHAASTYTAEVKAKATLLPASVKAKTLTGRGFGADVRLAAANVGTTAGATLPTIKLGTRLTDAYSTERKRVLAAAFVPQTSTYAWALNVNSISPAGTNSTTKWVAASDVPAGNTIVKVRARLNRRLPADKAELNVYSASAAGLALFTITAPNQASSFTDYDSSALNISSTIALAFHFTAFKSTGSGARGELQHVDLFWKRTDLRKVD